MRRLAAAAIVAAALAGAGCGGEHDAALPVARPVPPPDVAARTVPHRRKPQRIAPERRRSRRRADAVAIQGARSLDADPRDAAAADGRIFSATDRAEFEHLAASLGGEHGLAVSGVGFSRHVERLGTVRDGVAWSTSKVPVAMAVIAREGVQPHGDSLARAITASDNAAAVDLWTSLGDGAAAAAAADAQLRAAGDMNTTVEPRSLRGDAYTPFGQTNWALDDQTRFAAGLPCSPAGAQVLALMGDVVADQRWGLGAAAVPAQFKGGWGPGSAPGLNGGYFDRQFGVVLVGGKPLAVALATRPRDGAHASGVRNLTAIARWLVAHADVTGLPARPGC